MTTTEAFHYHKSNDWMKYPLDSSSSLSSSSSSPRRRYSSSSSSLLFSKTWDEDNNNDNVDNNKDDDDDDFMGTESSSLSDAISNLPRIYVDAPSGGLSTHAIVPLTANQANYLTVMRITNIKRWGSLVGHLRLFNGYDGEWLAKVLLLTDSDTSRSGGSQSKPKKNRKRGGGALLDDTVVECLECLRTQTDPNSSQSHHIHLHMGRLKKPRRKWVLEKVTELGIHSIDVIDTEYSAVTDGWEYDKHVLQVVEAAEQSERLTIPDVAETPRSWKSMLDLIQNRTDADNTNHVWLICRERSTESVPLWQALSSRPPLHDSSVVTRYHVLVGPEGGWSPLELTDLEALQQQQPNEIQFVSLGPLVLRAETAAIAAVSAVALAQSVDDVDK